MRITAFAAALLAATAFVMPASATSLEDAVKAVYKLYDSERPNCSSVAVSKTQLVTAAHCLGGKQPTLRIYNEGFDKQGKKWEVRSYSSYTLTVVRSDKNDDVAFLELMDKSLELSPVEIAETYEPKIGDRLMAVGFPRVEELTLTEGLFTATVALPDLNMEGPFYKTTVAITGGSSGGALIRDFGNGDYKLIGVATAGYRDVDFQTYFSTVEKVNTITKNLLDDGTEEVASASEKVAQRRQPDGWAIDLR